jgi:hypothetical protein
MGMTVLYFDLREQDCYRFGLVCQETFSGYCVMCGASAVRRSLQRMLNKSSSECQEDPSLPTVGVCYIK